jgi:predicted butyrate kinase (DUF1464 family)
MVRVAGTDPGTSSLDVLIFADGRVEDQVRFDPVQLRADPDSPARWLQDRGPFHLVAGPSGYGLPLRRAAECRAADFALMALVRPDESDQAQGVTGFLAVARSLAASGLPIVFLPGVIQLGTVPAHRKVNRVDLGTADKLCVVALALAHRANPESATFCLVELGSAFTACAVVSAGKVVDGLGGTSGPVGWRSNGCWDGEVAYLFSPLTKGDLFTGGVTSAADRAMALTRFRESLRRAVAGLRAVTPFEQVILSGRLLEEEPELADHVCTDLAAFGSVEALPPLPGAWVKHAAQGAAVVADGLAGGRHAALIELLEIRAASGTVLDWLQHPRAAACRAGFQDRAP